jgi:hypothetical protein
MKLSKDARFIDYEDAFTWLDEAMITNACFNASDPNFGLSLNRDRLTLKMYMADTGLLLSQAFSENDDMHQEVAKAIIQDRLEVNNGMIFENIVAQMFTALNKKLYFYSRADNQDRSNTMEIDFLIVDKSNRLRYHQLKLNQEKTIQRHH